MKTVTYSAAVLVTLWAVGCASPQERASLADAKFKEEKVEILEEYKECVKENLGDEEKLASCEYMLKAIEATK